MFNHVNTDWLIISLLNTVREKKLQLGKQNMKTNEWLGNLWPRCFSRIKSAFLSQNYPKYISDVVSKILEEKKTIIKCQFYLNLWSSWNWVSCGQSWKSLWPIFLMFRPTDFGGFLVCCYKAIQQLNGVEKNYVAISLMLTTIWLDYI